MGTGDRLFPRAIRPAAGRPAAPAPRRRLRAPYLPRTADLLAGPVFAVAMLAGLPGPAATAGAAAPPAPGAPRLPDGTRFALGVEYMVPRLAETYAKTGVVWVKAMGEGFSWDEIEPDPPVNGKHTYRWDYPDRLILEYQRAGFRHFHIYVKSKNRWASTKPVKLIGGGSSLPKPEYMDDYAAFLRALVRRYDTKSPERVPGLLYPVEWWEIEAEWGTGFWQGTVEEYLTLLKVAYPTVKQANPNAKVILIGFFLAGLFEGHPDPKDIPSTLAAMPAKRRAVTKQYLDEMRELLSHPGLFDAVEFHSLSDWSEIPGMTRFIRATMRERGYEKPIWVGDVNYTASPLVFWDIPVPPYTETQLPGIRATLDALASPRHPRHAGAMAWFRAEQSRGLVKKAVLAMAEGAAGINLGNLEDWGIFSFAPRLAGTAAFHGMIETSGIPRKPGEPRPAYHALALVARKLGGFSDVRAINAGAGVHAYRFEAGGRRVYVAWYDDGKRYLPGDAEPSAAVEFDVPSGPYVITETPTKQGEMPQERAVRADGGRLKLTLGATPLFFEPARGGD